ncbi:amino acid adenylation domain-containing protein [Pedobacter sp. UYP1]|uniref:amino acid adenylation domain-containing protein n=1 Tax=Pedobacter sp. UYP1 TaxID=1756396 RepID=UPI0033953FF7
MNTTLNQVSPDILGTIKLKESDQIAISFLNEHITYKELNEKSNQLANFFISKGIKKRKVIGVGMSLSIDYVIAMLAIMKAGAVFLPLQIAGTSKRLEQILDIAKPVLILENNREKVITNSLVFNTSAVYQIEEADVIPWCNFSTLLPELLIEGDDPVYIFFTSGSTGGPKAIVGKHKSLAHFIIWESNTYQLNHQIRVGAMTPTTFDPSLRDLLVPLFNGGILVIPNQENIDFSERLKWLIEEKINLIHIVPSVYEKIHDELELLGHHKTKLELSHIFFAGESLYAERVSKWKMQLPESTLLINLYGPTETTLAKFHHQLTAQDLLKGGIIPLGKAISDTTVLLFDERDQPVEAGTIGEIIIHTEFCSLGYLGEELNTSKFIDYAGGKSYKTGDLGKLNEEGNLEYHGRIDTQIKINGVRIEISEIESTLLKYQGVKKCAVLYIEHSQTVLSAFIISDEQIIKEELRLFMKDYLPQPMIPAQFITLDNFPYNQNGKIDRVALAQLLTEQTGIPEQTDILEQTSATEAVAEQFSELEQLIFEIWAEVLKKEKIGLHDNFFEIGGHSLNGLVIVSKVFKKLGIRFEITSFFNNPTISSFAAVISQLHSQNQQQGQNQQQNQHTQQNHDKKQAQTNEEIKLVPTQALYQVSNAQKLMFLLNEITGNSSVYNIQGAYTIKGQLNCQILEESFKELISRHEALRTSFVKDDEGDFFQRILPVEEVDFKLGITQIHSAGACHDFLQTAFSYAFDLTKDLLLRAGLIEKDGEYILYYCMHHIISDGWSLEVLISDLLHIYKGKLKTPDSLLAPLKLQYKDYAAWDNQRNSELVAAEKYWLTQFSGDLPVLNFPLNFSRPAVQHYAGDSISIDIPQETVQGLRNSCKTQNASYFSGLLTVLYSLLYRYTGQKDIVLGSPVANRDNPELKNQIGLYVNTIAYRAAIKEDDSFNTLLHTIKNMVIEGNQHKNYPFEKLIENLDITRDLSLNPLFSVMVNFQTPQEIKSTVDLPENLSIEKFEFPQIKSKFDFSFYFYDQQGQTKLMLIYNTSLFTRKFMQDLLDNFLNLAKSLVVQPETNLSYIPYLSDKEKKKVLEDFNHTNSPKAAVQSLTRLFSQHVKHHFSNTAFIDQGKTYSYGFVERLSNQFAHYLNQEYAVGKNDRLIVSLERNQWLPIAILGILKLNAVYVPVEPGAPKLFQERIIEEAGCKHVIDEVFLEKFIAVADNYAAEEPDAINYPAGESAAVNYENDMITIIYTTGSTGKPKGVIIKNSNIVNRLEWMWAEYPFHPDEVCVLKTAISFVDHLWELFGPLLKGIPLVCLHKNDISDIPHLIGLLNKFKVTRIVLVPSLLKEILAYPEACREQLSALAYWTSSGEDLAGILVQKFYEIFDSRKHKLLNIYGSTEVTADATCHDTSIDFKQNKTSLALFNTDIDIPGLIENYDHAEHIFATDQPDHILSGFKDVEFEAVTSPEDYLKYLEQRLLPNVINISSNKFIGHMTGPLPDFSLSLSSLVTRLNQNLVKIETSLAATMIEIEVIKRFHQAVFNRSDAFYRELSHKNEGIPGIFTNGGTLSNITALFYALNNCLAPHGSYQGYGRAGLVKGLLHYGYKDVVILGSRWCHYSVEKALKLFGLGKDSFREIIVDQGSEADIRKKITQQILALKAQNVLILSIIGVAGTTESGAVEPLNLLGELAKEQAIHYHVDAAFGGAYILSEKYSHLLDGINKADSVTLCAHKQLHVPVGSSFCLFADPGFVKNSENNTNYQARKNSYDLGKFTIEGTRNFNSLILHGLFSVFGKKGLAEVIDYNHELSRTFADLVDQNNAFELFESPKLNIVLYRYVPFSLRNKTVFTDEELLLINDLNEQIQKTQFKRGNSFVSYTLVRNYNRDSLQHVFFRTVFSNPHTTQKVLKEILQEQLDIAAELDHTLDIKTEQQNYNGNFTVHTNTNIGKPISNVKVYILDDHLQLLPVGLEGIIYIGGENITDGYLGDEELTGDKFIENPFEPGEILFRTDDIGKWTIDGEVIYIGRRDLQYKVRGNRINTSYIEEIITQLPGINQALVIFNEEKLTAFVTAGTIPVLSALRLMLKEILPAYMIPNEFVWVKDFPKLTNGKINRKALHAEIGTMLTENVERILPENDLEQQVYDLWKLIFNQKELSVRADFFAIGGHSLSLMKLIQYYHKAFHVQVKMQDLFLTTTITGHADLIRNLDKNPMTAIEKVAESDTYPVSDGQRRIWTLSQTADSSRAYHMSGAMTIHKALNTANFTAAIREVIKRHESLRTNFIWTEKGEVRQVIRPDELLDFGLEIIDVADQTQKEIQIALIEFNNRPFNLADDLLLRIRLFQVAADHFIFSYCFHHIISDLRSMKIFARDLWNQYQHLNENFESTITPLKLQYKDYSAWLQEAKQRIQIPASKYYKEMLRDFELLNLPADYQRPLLKTYTGNTYNYEIPMELCALVKSKSLSYGVTPFTVLVAAINGLFYRYTQQEDILIGMVTEGRGHPDIDHQIGFFVNTLPLRTQLDPEKGFGLLCKEIQHLVLQNFNFQAYALDELIDELKVARDPSRSPLFDVVVTYENYEQELIFSEMKALNLEKKTAQFDMTFGFVENRDFISAKIEFNTSLYAHSTIQRMAAHLTEFLAAALARAEDALYTLDYLTPEEKNYE